MYRHIVTNDKTTMIIPCTPIKAFVIFGAVPYHSSISFDPSITFAHPITIVIRPTFLCMISHNLLNVGINPSGSTSRDGRQNAFNGWNNANMNKARPNL
mmetsp:Transcript_5171/g.5959  ORF Transcript_5171/g.5959 Transcript_5171/m.5959 type:complete len:99 (-) Transcript_5171:1130-1426(-)